MKRNKMQAEPTRRCGDCRHAQVVLDCHTLTVKDRLPTLARCPFDGSRKRLLSEIACKTNFRAI